jgi:hypothetical protein
MLPLLLLPPLLLLLPPLLLLLPPLLLLLQVEGLFGMDPSCGINYLQAATDIETAISIVHHHPAQPWLAVVHSLAPWATPGGRQLREARLRLANEVYEPIMQHVESW